MLKICTKFIQISQMKVNCIKFSIISDDTYKKNRAKEIADKRLSDLNNTSPESKITPQ